MIEGPQATWGERDKRMVFCNLRICALFLERVAVGEVVRRADIDAVQPLRSSAVPKAAARPVHQVQRHLLVREVLQALHQLWRNRVRNIFVSIVACIGEKLVCGDRHEAATVRVWLFLFRFDWT